MSGKCGSSGSSGIWLVILLSGVAILTGGDKWIEARVVDLMPDTYWAGLVTGDEITLSGWDRPCACGRTGPHVLPPVRRYSELEGGDDRVVCAGAPEAHDRALEFLAELSM